MPTLSLFSKKKVCLIPLRHKVSETISFHAAEQNLQWNSINVSVDKNQQSMPFFVATVSYKINVP